MTLVTIFAMLAIGTIAGLLAMQITNGRLGIFNSIVAGVVGAVIAGLLLGSTFGGGLVGQIVGATIGAVVLLFLVDLAKRKAR